MKRSVVLLLILLAVTPLVYAQTPAPAQYAAAIVVEPTTGKVLFEQNSHQPLPVASMTKMMTVLIVMENIKEGALTMDTPVQVSAEASKIGGSQVFLKQGEVFPVKDLLAAAMVHSANDAAYALAEKVAGSREAFVSLMNTRAAQLGMKDSHFYSPHGLPAEKGEPDDVMSAADAARIAQELMKYPYVMQLAKLENMPFRGGQFTLRNPNHLLQMYSYATGLKTGFHNKAGFCVTGTAHQGDMDLICVIMGSKQKNGDFRAAAKLFAESFAMWRMASPVRQGQALPQRVAISGGEMSTVPVVAGGEKKLLMKKGAQSNVSVDVQGTNAAAPIRKGQQVGWIVIKQDGQVAAKIPALSALAVEEMPWWKKWWPF